MPGRTLAIGDIHGCDTALETLLSRLQPAPHDLVVVLGDVVDRGPNTRRCVEMLLELKRSCRLVFLMGNHEEMLLDAIDMGSWANSWGQFGGQETIESYGGLREIPERHLEFFRTAENYYESPQAIFVHANLKPGVPLDKQPGDWLRWVHLSGNEQPHPSGKWVVCGHTRLRNGVPAILNGWICIDTAACDGGALTCLDVDELLVHQADEAGGYRDPVPLADIAVHYRPRE